MNGPGDATTEAESALNTRSVAFGVEYDGRCFHGMQSQAGVATVQDALQGAIARVGNERHRETRIVAAGRTDAGVHATQQVVSFTTNAVRTEDAWRMGVTSLTPDGLGVVWCRTLPTGFNARFDARWRRYVYVVHDGSTRPIIGRGLCTWVQQSLDETAMQHAALPLVGEHDFSAFRAAACQSRSPWRCIHHLRVRRIGSFVAIDVRANAFVLRMVRNIAGTLLAVGRGTLPTGAAAELLAGRDRRQAPPTAPAHGLYLIDVGYPNIPTTPRPPPLLASSDVDWLRA